MTAWYFVAFGLSFVIGAIATLVIRRLALRWRMVDEPSTDPARKHHAVPTPLLGGAAMIIASLATWWVLDWAGVLITPAFPQKFLIGLSLAGLLLAVGGALDDRWHLSAGKQIIWPIMAAVVVIGTGIGIDFLTNPWGGLISLDQTDLTVFRWGDLAYQLTLWADVFTFVWLLGMMYTTKILDGLDGLVSGVGVIGAVIVFLLTLRPEVNQSSVGLLALGFGGAAAGFLIFNWHPAKIFLGESGALFVGFVLGGLAIISGGKIATALLILGLPILDLAWVIFRRGFIRRTSPFRTADRSHLHLRLLDAGLSVRQSVLLLYAVTGLFGLSTLYFHGLQKVYALLGLAALLVLFAGWVARRARRISPTRTQ